MDRQKFEALTTKQQRAYIARVYPRLKDEVIDEYNSFGDYRDFSGDIRTVIHHCWSKAQAPLWYQIDKRNMILWSPGVHYAFHNIPKDKWTKAQRQEAVVAELIKVSMQDDDKDFKSNN